LRILTCLIHRAQKPEYHAISYYLISLLGAINMPKIKAEIYTAEGRDFQRVSRELNFRAKKTYGITFNAVLFAYG
jgi:hypothetical protein